LAEIPEAPTRFHFTDFASFALRAGADSRVLKNLESTQADFDTEGDGALAAMHVLLLQRHVKVDHMPIGEFHRMLGEIALELNLPFPRKVQSFGQWLTNRKFEVERALGVQIDSFRLHANQRILNIVRSPIKVQDFESESRHATKPS